MGSEHHYLLALTAVATSFNSVFFALVSRLRTHAKASLLEGNAFFRTAFFWQVTTSAPSLYVKPRLNQLIVILSSPFIIVAHHLATVHYFFSLLPRVNVADGLFFPPLPRVNVSDRGSFFSIHGNALAHTYYSQLCPNTYMLALNSIWKQWPEA